MCGAYRFRRRERPQVLLEILQSAIEAQPPTRIMFRCNLDYKTTIRHVEFLIRKGFMEQMLRSKFRGIEGVRRRKSRYFYVATDKALELLRHLDENLLYELVIYEEETDD